MAGRVRRAARWAGTYFIAEPMQLEALRQEGSRLRSSYASLRAAASGEAAGGVRFVLREDRGVDLERTAAVQRFLAQEAFERGEIPKATRDTLVRMTPRDVEAIMDSMLAPTACRAVVLLGVAALVFALWAAGVASRPQAYANLFYVLCWLSAVTYLVTIAVLAAYKNWQMRTRRLGRLSEFLLYADTWVPSWPHLGERVLRIVRATLGFLLDAVRGLHAHRGGSEPPATPQAPAISRSRAGQPGSGG